MGEFAREGTRKLILQKCIDNGELIDEPGWVYSRERSSKRDRGVFLRPRPSAQPPTRPTDLQRAERNVAVATTGEGARLCCWHPNRHRLTVPITITI